MPKSTMRTLNAGSQDLHAMPPKPISPKTVKFPYSPKAPKLCSKNPYKSADRASWMSQREASIFRGSLQDFRSQPRQQELLGALAWGVGLSKFQDVLRVQV